MMKTKRDRRSFLKNMLSFSAVLAGSTLSFSMRKPLGIGRTGSAETGEATGSSYVSHTLPDANLAWSDPRL